MVDQLPSNGNKRDRKNISIVFQQERDSLVGEIVELLLPFPHLIGRSLNLLDKKGRKRFSFSLLHLLLLTGYSKMETIQELIDAASNVNLSLLDTVDSEGNLPLHVGCYCCIGDDEVIVKLANQYLKTQKQLADILGHRTQ